MPISRRHTLAAALAAIATIAGHGATHAADEYPFRPVSIVTPFAAGSGPDAVLRLVADRLGKLWNNQRITIDNKPGGGGFIAIEQARRGAPDGYTLLQLDSEHLAAIPHLYKSRNFEALKTFEPVATLFRTPFLLAVAADSKWKSVADLIADAKANPAKISFGSWGIGSPGHLGGEHLELLTGIDMQHVPYREVSQLYTNVGTGDVGWSFGSLPSSAGAYKAGKLRYLAIAAPRRIPQMPDVPTVAESGGPAALDVNSFVVLVAPRGLPPAVRDKLNADVRKVLADPEIKARFDTFAFEVVNWDAAEIERQAAAKSRIYGDLVKRKSISLE